MRRLLRHPQRRRQQSRLLPRRPPRPSILSPSTRMGRTRLRVRRRRPPQPRLRRRWSRIRASNPSKTSASLMFPPSTSTSAHWRTRISWRTLISTRSSIQTRTLLVSALTPIYPTRRTVLRRGPTACEGVKVLTVASGLYYPPIYPCFCTFDHHRFSVFSARGLSISRLLVAYLVMCVRRYREIGVSVICISPSLTISPLSLDLLGWSFFLYLRFISAL